jgi:hypothetical protein
MKVRVTSRTLPSIEQDNGRDLFALVAFWKQSLDQGDSRQESTDEKQTP